MSNDIFHKSFQMRSEYLVNPIEKHDYDRIVDLYDEELERCFYKLTIKSAIKLILIGTLVLVIYPFILMAGLISRSEVVVYLCAYGPIALIIIIGLFTKPKVCIEIEGVKFKSTDHMGKYRKVSRNRLLPCSVEENIYAKGTLHYEFFEKVTAMGRPVLLFELDMLDSLSKNQA